MPEINVYQTGEPIPDGFVHIQLVNPLNPWIDYLDLNMMPANLEEEFNIRIPFADMRTHRIENYGVAIVYSDHTTFYPWTNILSYDVVHNSPAYIEALQSFQLGHDHDWAPYVDEETGKNYRWCDGCKVTDAQLDQIEQARIDRTRGLKT